MDLGNQPGCFQTLVLSPRIKKIDNQINILYEQQEQFGFCYIQIDKANAKVLEKVLSPPLIETTSPVTAWFPYCCWLIIYQ